MECCRILLNRALLVGSCLLVSTVVLSPLGRAASAPTVVEVPKGPAFVKPPSATEIKARKGLTLKQDSLLRTTKPGRMQVKLSDGREFRMGGNALLRLKPTSVQLLKGSIIGWIKPGQKRSQPFTIQTRLATASIQGTTVFIELSEEVFKVFSWEGRVLVTTSAGEQFSLDSGQQLLLDLTQPVVSVSGERFGDDGFGNEGYGDDGYGANDAGDVDSAVETFEWSPPQRISEAEVRQRMQNSQLINGFSTPLDTLPEIERELGVPAAGSSQRPTPP